MSMGDIARQIPSIHDLLERPEVTDLLREYPRELVVHSVREVVRRLRQQVSMHSEQSLAEAVGRVTESVKEDIAALCRPSLQAVVNATGVLLHTNLGRAPLSARALAQVTEVAAGYCNLEFGLDEGTRGQRDRHADAIFLRLFERRGIARADLRCAVVNNCAAATLLLLNSLAEGGEVVVSRGEMVEIGGGFRVPEIMNRSGALLREVGTTNRTRISDYAHAIGSQTKLLLRVHQSNFEMRGFTERPELSELVELSRATGIPLFEDQGTGCIVPLDHFGIAGESSFLESVRRGVNVVAASGDKLFGGPQCGLIVGDAASIEQVHRNPLFRALRVDKMVYAALEGTVQDYLTGFPDAIPVLRLMRIPLSAIQHRCQTIADNMPAVHLHCRVVETESVIGGGTTPGAVLPSYAVALRHRKHSAEALSLLLRQSEPPVVARIKEDEVLLDLRTVEIEADTILVRHLHALL